MKKLLLVSTLLLTIVFLPYVNAASFSDTDGHKYQTAIDYISDQGIVQGYSDGSFGPNNKINRAELLKIIMEANDHNPSGSNCFTDVKSDWYAPYVCKAKELGIIKGYSDNTFKPGNNINFVEALKILENGYGADISEGNTWYQGYVDEAEEKNMIPNDIYDYGTEITRGQMADMITRQLKYEDGTQDDYIASLTSGGAVDTNQNSCYNSTSAITCPSSSFYGQDAQYAGPQPSYTDNGDGTVTDNVTGLMWQQDPGNKQEYYDGVAGANGFNLSGFSDWRVPTVKELYSLIDFSGQDVDPSASSANTPFINDDVFGFEYGDTSAGDRIIDSQWISSNVYVSDVMNGQECFFGLNFADGRIKCYPTVSANNNGYFGIYVRGNAYGINDFVDNGDKTITDNMNGLMWQKADSKEGLNWEEALDHCEDLSLAGNSDWRLPNVKELQLLVDYTRSPDTTSSAALDPIFDISEITNEAGKKDYPWHWSGTTHANAMGGASASYVAFGRALGNMGNGWIDVHGAGAQRSDPKTGDPNDYPDGHGPQGDAIRIYNYVRCVRNGATFNEDTEIGANSSSSSSPTSGSSTGGSQTGPPQEAINACSGKSNGNSCSFEAPFGTISGTCLSPAGELACVPQ